MRFAWPFRRATSGGGTAADDHAPWTGRRSAVGAWRSLPPLAETIGEPPLIAPAQPFKAELAAATPPPSMLPPLAHGRALEAPKGLVVGLAQPARQSSIGGSPSGPVQRAPLRPGRRPPPGDTNDNDTSEDAASDPTSTPAPALGDPATTALRRLSVADAAPSGPRLDLTRAVIAAQRAVGIVRPAVRSGSAGAVPFEPTVQRAPAAPAVAAAALDAPTPARLPVPLPAVQRAPANGPAIDEAPRLTIGQARRLGLGAPIAGGPVSTAKAVAAPIARPQPSPTPSAARSAVAVDGEPDSGPVARPLNARVPPAPVPVAPATAAPATMPSVTRSSGRPSSGVQRSPVAAASAPLTSGPALRGRVQRAPLTSLARATVERDAASDSGSPTGSTIVPSATGPVTVHRGADASAISSAIEARSFTHGGEVYLPASHGPLTSGPARSLLAHELTHVVQQRRLGASLPTETSRPGQALEAEAVAAERAAKLPLAIPAQPTPNAPSSAPAGPTPQRSPELPAPAVAMSPPRPETATVHLSTEMQRAPTPGAAGARPAGKSKQTERELDDLARQLYARIGNRLRRDLIVDRERAGMAVDLS